MNSNPYTIPAFIFLAAVLFGCGAWAFLVITRPVGNHAKGRSPAASAAGARFAADLQGLPEPPEGPVVPDCDPPPAEITWPADDWAGRPRDPEDPGPEPRDETWWDQRPPQPPAVEILTGPGTSNPQTSAVTISTLATARDAVTLGRVRDKLMPEAWKPDEPGDVTFTPADPDATLTDLRPVPAGDTPQYLAAPR